MNKSIYRITEEDLKFIGFKRFDETDGGWEHPFHYYTYEIKGLSLISNANDECYKDRWWVELGEYPEVGKFRDVDKLINFINLLKSLRK